MRIVGIDFRDGIPVRARSAARRELHEGRMEILRPLLAETGVPPSARS